MVGLDGLAEQLSLEEKERASENEVSPDEESEEVDVWTCEEMPLVDACVQLVKVASETATVGSGAEYLSSCVKLFRCAAQLMQ